jgi:prepilin-type N-terminal cleavage/methylation domain-containing protein
MKKGAFTITELIFVIVIIGILSVVAIPKFSDIKNRAKISNELSTASAIQTNLQNIHGEWTLNEEDFDWDGDGVVDDIEHQFSKSGFPIDLSKNSDPFGKIFNSKKSNFTKRQGPITKNNITYIIYTSIASDPTLGVEAKKIDNPFKPDKNDFWIYIVDTNVSNGCTISSDYTKTYKVSAGNFLLVDVNGTLPINLSSLDLGINFIAKCF